MALIRAVAEGEAAEAWARQLDTDWPAQARAIKAEGDCGVWRGRLFRAESGGGELARRDVVIKTWRLRGRRRVQSMLTLSPAWRHWRAARRLDAAGFRAARPLALATVELDGALTEALALEAIAGPTALETLTLGLPLPQEREIARAIGAQVGRLAAEGWYNRDHKPSNLIVARGAEADAAAAKVVMIDCVGFRRVSRSSDEYLARMLAKLLIEPLGCQRPPQRAMRWRVLRAAAGIDGTRVSGEARARLRRLWGEVARLVSEHGDPAPKVDPLAGTRSLNRRNET